MSNIRLLDKILYGVVAAFVLMFAAALILSRPDTGVKTTSQSASRDAESVEPAANVLTGLTLEISSEKNEFEIGETIPIKMTYRYDNSDTVQIEHLPFDQYGRIRELSFSASKDAGGSMRDPTDERTAFMDGMFVIEELSKRRPYTQSVPLNTYLRFDTPGNYSVYAESKLVANSSVESLPLKIRIVQPDAQKRTNRIAELEKLARSGDVPARQKAVSELSFLIDERAIPILAHALGDEDPKVQRDARFGLYSFLNLNSVQKAIREEVSKTEPARIIRQFDTTLDLLETVVVDGKHEGSDNHWPALRWLSDTLFEKLEALPESEARALFKTTTELMAMVPITPKHWKFLTSHRNDFHGDRFSDFMQQLSGSFHDERFKPELNQIAEDAEMPQELRKVAAEMLVEFGN